MLVATLLIDSAAGAIVTRRDVLVHVSGVARMRIGLVHMCDVRVITGACAMCDVHMIVGMFRARDQVQRMTCKRRDAVGQQDDDGGELAHGSSWGGKWTPPR
jgi:hypothetical protein